MDKFGCCDTCLNREDDWICEDCVDANGYEFDESLIEIDENGLLCRPDKTIWLMAA